jgi:hypothetical protein
VPTVRPHWESKFGAAMTFHRDERIFAAGKPRSVRALMSKKADGWATMCESCVEIDKQVERHRETLRSTQDENEIERIKRLIASLYADRVRLHRNPER